MLKQGSLERVARDAETARQEVEAAFRHLTSAARIADVDSSGAFALGYDAMRKVISGHLRAAGLRVAKGVGHHVRTGEYAREALDHLDVDEHLDAFDDLRQLRNQSEYDALEIDSWELEDLLRHAKALVRVIAGELDVEL